MLGSSLNPINNSIIATTLIAIGHTFHAGAASTIWLVSTLYLASAIGQPTMGRLAERLGLRRVFVAGLILVGIGGALGTMAPTSRPWSPPASSSAWALRPATRRRW